MPEPISRDQAVLTLLRLGYEILAEEGNFIMLADPAYPARPLMFDFNRRFIPWEDFRWKLEFEGVDVSRFLAELESS